MFHSKVTRIETIKNKKDFVSWNYCKCINFIPSLNPNIIKISSLFNFEKPIKIFQLSKNKSLLIFKSYSKNRICSIEHDKYIIEELAVVEEQIEDIFFYNKTKTLFYCFDNKIGTINLSNNKKIKQEIIFELKNDKDKILKIRKANKGLWYFTNTNIIGLLSEIEHVGFSKENKLWKISIQHKNELFLNFSKILNIVSYKELLFVIHDKHISVLEKANSELSLVNSIPFQKGYYNKEIIIIDDRIFIKAESYKSTYIFEFLLKKENEIIKLYKFQDNLVKVFLNKKNAFFLVDNELKKYNFNSLYHLLEIDDKWMENIHLMNENIISNLLFCEKVFYGIANNLDEGVILKAYDLFDGTIRGFFTLPDKFSSYKNLHLEFINQRLYLITEKDLYIIHGQI